MRAQSTIEYIVIIAIIIVIGLVVVSMTMNLYDSQQVTTNTQTLKEQIGSKGINILDAITNFDETYLNIKNVSGETMTLTKIVGGGEENEYNKTLGQGNEDILLLKNLCHCEEGEKTRTCEIEIQYTTQHGLPKKIKQTITITCEPGAKPNKEPTKPLFVLPEHCFDLEPKDGKEDDDDRIWICSLNDLNRIREKYDGNFVLMKNIDASDTINWNNGEGWEPIGEHTGNPTNKYFTGSFDGQNNIISNLYVNKQPSIINGTGLFGFTSGTIKNLGLVDANVNSAPNQFGSRSDYVGSITGYLATGGSINNSYATGRVVGNSFVGGLAGNSSNSTISNSYFDGNIIGYQETGGIVGRMSSNPNIINVYSKGNIESIINSGGIVGEMLSGKIINSYSSINLITNYTTGGLVGTIDYGTIINSYATGTVKANNANEGGIIGIRTNLNSIITNCGWWTGSGPEFAIGNPTENVEHNESEKNTFYNSSHEIYNTTPNWGFGKDANWIINNDYPILAWQNN